MVTHKPTTAGEPTLPTTISFDLEHVNYVYKDAGEIVGIKCRRLNGDGRATKKFRKGDIGISVPYRLDKVKEALRKKIRPLCIPDGERDTETLLGLGCVATCAPYGMGSWNEAMVRHLDGVKVVYIFVDQDGGTGMRQAEKLRDLLDRTIKPERVILVRASVGKDIYDHYVADGGPWVQIEDDEPQIAPEEKRPAVEIIGTMLPSALQLAVARLEAMPAVGLRKVSDDPPKWNGRCPLPEHDDKNPSFAIGLGDRVAVVVTCSGCDGTKDEFAALLEIDPKEFSTKSDVATQGEGVPGGTFILDGDAAVSALWGSGDKVLWAKDEGFLIVGPQGVGKSTLIQQLALHMIGLLDGSFLGFHVEPIEGRILYLAMDRPKQIKRSLARMVGEEHRKLLDERVIVWPRPLQTNILKEPASLADWIEKHVGSVAAVIVDSYKDLAPGLSQDDVGSRVNLAAQELIARGVQWAGLHHQRKAQSDNKRPDKLSDVYGSEWLTAGMGSVALLWGQPGSSNVELRHLKQPMEDAGPLTIVHDHREGRTVVSHKQQILLGMLIEDYDSGDAGVSEDILTSALFGTDGDLERKRTQRELKKMLDENIAWKEEGKRGGKGGGGVPAKWHLKMH